VTDRPPNHAPARQRTLRSPPQAVVNRRDPSSRPEVPTARHSGTNDVNPLAALSGRSIPFTAEQIHARYPSADAYLHEWDAAVDRVREQGLVLDPDLDLLRHRGSKIADELWP
jgi:hypothetical protein